MPIKAKWNCHPAEIGACQINAFGLSPICKISIILGRISRNFLVWHFLFFKINCGFKCENFFHIQLDSRLFSYIRDSVSCHIYNRSFTELMSRGNWIA
jgi:hypothetical protein